ncbi:uncharacterized protein [Mytilus edulis]|uniref:uncharacterized protein n=1 Tax=Mytilus edulis TaxID=6550 RepID=UPI0039EE5F01
MSVDIASKGIKNSQSFIDAVELIEHVLITIPTITEDRQTLIKSVEKEAQMIEDEIRKVKEEAISHIESLENSLLEDLKLKKDKIVANAKVVMKKIEDINKMTQDKKDTFDIVEKHGSEKQAFLAVHVHKTDLNKLEEKISTITEKTTYSSIRLNSKYPKKNITSIGTIETTEVPISTKFVKRKKRQSQIPMVHRQDLPTFIQKDAITVSGTVGGLAVNYKDELFLTSSCMIVNQRILVYDINEKLKYQMNLSYQPRQIALFPCKNTGIIMKFLGACMQFIDFQTKELMNEVSLKECEGEGVAASNENIFIGTKGNIIVLDSKGRFIRSIKMKNDKLTPMYIVLDKSGNIYHSDSEVVYCTRIDGKNMFTYKPSKNKSPNGIAIDNQGYVYVVVQNQGVCRLRPDGTFSDLVVEDCLHGTLSDICFNKDCTKLYVSHKLGVLVYNRQ